MSSFPRLTVTFLTLLSVVPHGLCEDDPDDMRSSMIEAYNLSRIINKSLTGYDRKVRPNAGGPPVIVKIEFKVISFGEIKEANMEYSMDIFMRQWWTDPRFKNNYSVPFNMAADPTKLFWTLDTYFWNVKDAKYHYVTRENMRVKISPDGEIYYSTRITLTAQCDMDLRLYPMDTQYCPLIIESYAYTTADVDYRWKGGNNQGIEIVTDEMAQFDLLDVKTRTKSQTNSKGSFASLAAVFHFRRRTESFISSIFVPAIVLVVLSWCCFFISPAAVPARVALSITTILTSILLKGNVNRDMPKVSYMKAVDYFLLTSFGFIFAALMEFIIVLNTDPEWPTWWKRRKKKQLLDDKKEIAMECEAQSQGSVDLIVQVMDEGVCRIRNNKGNIKLKPQTKQQSTTLPLDKPKTKVHWIDRVSRITFPALYVIFLISYTIYYGVLRDDHKEPMTEE
ncbi:gamma-aminobutyric acid receptor subunit beta-2-like isoform X1 [Montipora foliosa]|uniref:gamma-aminobutyric acid receptor subunit beta-2-like isoform X1 n=2 Tax=Montipora foliosa TaxID=591990 RepID=UPI0035F17211